ncbi:hypothetical protein G3I59_45805 [Amycolatopsis rubida]|uniref:Uncharacterized protein n=1 Tax=Amycolatopsis rubida TaxID=112413 RepID=A0A1I5YKJ4_9PSEU|nr:MULTISPECIES: hypothetical protein [Amycolatopsis]MYW97737.1 hypothetical protein [Amycolatopsis rubida]NEC62723.1 hypothetical protein [Amycolatopsis rubida]OAP28148.1 hypothetical protein A4R44_01758 [Amycolatopsis sp. M39]SFQ44718.1 hypothetical protein SAMN05421854_112161 [Amycolatopsis rubida]
MPGLVELAYTTGGGVVGAALTNYFTKIQERRQLRAEVYRRLEATRAISGGVREIRIGLPPNTLTSRKTLADALGIVAVLEDGTDAHRALREALSELLTAVLVAGIPRRVADFAAGAHERVLESAVATAVNRRLGGLADTDQLTQAAQAYRAETTGLLLAVLWRPWRARLRTRGRIRELRVAVHALRLQQEAAVAALTRPEQAETLHQRLDPDGTLRETWIEDRLP